VIAQTSVICAIFSSNGAFLLGFDTGQWDRDLHFVFKIDFRTGIFSTTIAHLSFNIYMFGNEVGNPVLTGTLDSWQIESFLIATRRYRFNLHGWYSHRRALLGLYSGSIWQETMHNCNRFHW
jgi:hypothetical protein